MGWVSPSGFEDPNNKWSNEPYAYDEDTGTPSWWMGARWTWTDWIILTVDALFCSKIRFLALGGGGMNPSDVDIDVSNGGVDWVDVFQGAYPNRVWVEKDLPSSMTVDRVRLRFLCGDYYGMGLAQVYEVDFWEAEAPPPSGGILAQIM